MIAVLKKIFIIIFAACCVLVGIFLIQLIPQQPIKSLVKIPSSLKQKKSFAAPTITYRTDESSEASYRIAMVRPSGFPPAIQQAVDAFYDQAKNEILIAAQSNTSKNQYTAISEKPYVSQAGPYVFVIATTALYTGGAHDMVQYFQIAYDVRTKNSVTLDQFFKDPQTMYQTIQKEMLPVALKKVGEKTFVGREAHSITLEEKQQMAQWVNDGLTATADNYRYWYMTKENQLVFVFAPYQLGPWSLGQQVIAIPLETIKDSLNLAMFTFE